MTSQRKLSLTHLCRLYRNQKTPPVWKEIMTHIYIYIHTYVHVHSHIHSIQYKYLANSYESNACQVCLLAFSLLFSFTYTYTLVFIAPIHSNVWRANVSRMNKSTVGEIPENPKNSNEVMKYFFYWITNDEIASRRYGIFIQC